MIPQGRCDEKTDAKLAPKGDTEHPAKTDTLEQLLKDLQSKGGVVRVMTANDLLKARKSPTAWASIPQLIERLTDPTPLGGSDNWVGGQAANALSAITGRPFSLDQKEWKRWWDEEQKRTANPSGPGVEEKKVSPPTGRIAYGDTPEFWESYALVVATVNAVRHRDEGKHHVVSEVDLIVRESVPNRYAPDTRFTLTFRLDLRFVPSLDRIGYATKLEVGNRVMLMVAEEKGRLIHALPQTAYAPKVLSPEELKIALLTGPQPLAMTFRGITSFAMLPDSWKLHFPKEDDGVVAETVRVCQALSEKAVARRLELIEALQKAKPNARVQDLLRRRLEVTLESSLREAQEAMRLLKEAGKK